jgi:uncharacterized membrane protein YdjX (TVP38/TMEM64 family)
MFSPETITAFLEWVQSAGLWGAVLFSLAYIPAAILFVPASILTLAAGFVFGVAQGTVIVSLGSTAGAAAAFVVARTLGHTWVMDRMARHPRFNVIASAVESEAFTVVLLTRLSPLFPFNLLNYAFGVSSVPFKTYVLASWLGMLPGGLMYIYLGSAAQNVAALLSSEHHRTRGQQVMFALGLVATMAVTAIVTRTARRLLRTIVPLP